jgi:RimJ/RimL family protein N-acetyltransferase
MADKVLAREGRVVVRKFRRSDLTDRIAWPPYTDSLFTHLNFSLSTFIDREKWLFTRTVNVGRMYFAIEDENGRFIGEMSLRDIDAVKKVSRLGIHMASDKVSLGYGREGLEALLRHYFLGMQWNVMYLDVAGYNVRALRLYERLEFHHLSTFWRRSVDVDETILADPGRAAIRRFVRHAAAGLEVLHYDMAITKERYFETRGVGGAAASAQESPELERPA